MPRKPRLDVPGTLHHVIARGIERKPIFLDDTDRSLFLMRLKKVFLSTDARCLAWTFMPNHVHLLLRTGEVRLPKIMKRILTGYAMNFNSRHMRHGHLFQNRYKSILCQEDTYFLELVR